MADTIDIQSTTNSFSAIKHDWLNTNSYKNGEALVKTMPDPEDSSNNAASTEWVNNYVSEKMSPTPTINTPILTPMWFDHLVDSSAWVKSEFDRNPSTNYGWLYASAYDRIFQHIKNDYDTSDKIEREESYYDVEQKQTVAIKYYLANDGHKIIYTSGDGDNSDGLFKSCGVAWFYVYDARNRRFKLPRSRFGFQGLKENGSVGKYDAAGVPNVTVNGSIKWPTVTCAYTTKPSLVLNSGSGYATINTDTSAGGYHTHSVDTSGSHDHTVGIGPGNCSCAVVNSVKNSHYKPSQNYHTDFSGEHTHSLTYASPHTHHIDYSAPVTLTNISGSISGGSLSGSLNNDGNLSVNLTKEGDVYGKSTTVQPPATEMYLFFSTGFEDSSVAPYGFGGGVIDGTTCKNPSIGNVISTTESAKLYDVENDCFLFISVSGNDINGMNVKMNLNDRPIINYSDRYSYSGSYTHSFGVPAHKGSVISGITTTQNLSASFYEYRMYSTDPQIAMPDYSETPTTINAKDGGWTASKNGWIFIRETSSELNEHKVTVNDHPVLVPINPSSSDEKYPNLGNISFPVTRGDIISFTGIMDAIFYPCRTVTQSEPISYVVKTEFGNYATELDLSKTYKVGDCVRTTSDGVTYYYICTTEGTFGTQNFINVNENNVPTWWYRKYSDGWCEQGGFKSVLVSQIANGEIKLKLPMRSSNYNVSATVHYDYSQTVFTTPPIVSISPKDENTIFYIESTVTGQTETRPFSWEVRGKCN